MNSDARQFRCPNLNCRTDYFSVLQAEAPVSKPRCVECNTPFMAKEKGRFIHYTLARFD
jgi:hypothetical protein